VTSIADGLARLGVRRLLLAIHDASFPSDPDEDIGRGTPATRAAGRLFAYAKGLGFTGIQLGPQGQTSRDNPSPYDGTIFARHLGNASLAGFAHLVEPSEIARAVLPDPGGPARHAHAYDALHRLLAVAYAGLGAHPTVRARLAAFRRWHGAWLERDGLYEGLSAAYGGAGHLHWPARDRDLWVTGSTDERDALIAAHEPAIERFALGQLLVHDEHDRIRTDLARLGLALYGDVQVGYSDRDAWSFAPVFLRGYRMGAPPSRTNPDGQPWGYPVLDPDQLDGAARALVTSRAEKAFAEYDSLRIDHPHGLICPWVYAADTSDPGAAVRAGARLFESPDLPDHPGLARFAIARARQIDRAVPRYADHWVTELDAAQIDRYSIVFEALVASARRNGRAPEDLSCEVLSTMPRPLADVLARYGLGRWRITQKAKLDDPTDVYRTENAAPRDWVMLGNHDTAPIFALIRSWAPAQREAWARHLAARLHLPQPERLAQPGFLANAMLAELFVSRAENVSIFFADLFGLEDRFNMPGVVDAANWTLRLPPTFAELHAERLARGAALDLGLAVELALAAQEHGTERR
jgi:4-alpha-glucanotransferase